MKTINRLKHKPIILVIVILMIMLLNATVFAAVAYGQWGYIYNVFGYSYRMRNRIETGSTYVDAYVILECTTSSQCPAGYMGVKGRLYNDDGALIAERSWFYNEYPCPSIEISANAYGQNGVSYYSDGITRVWNGTGYWTYGGVPSPSLTFY